MGSDNRTPEYCIWAAMKSRCDNPKYKAYEQIGGRGISYDPRWQSYQEFYKDMGDRPDPEMILTRIDPDGDFTKENCIWGDYGVGQHHDKLRRNNTTGVKGVNPHRNKFQASIHVNAEKVHLGTFPTIEEAAEARREAEEKYW